jgi:hypothetical protein
MNLKPGDLVLVLGKLDNRIRDQLNTDQVIGTIDCYLRMEQAEIAVLLENGDIWIGMRREVQKL